MLSGSKAGVPWLPLLIVEAVLIMGSILVAFGLNGWWEGRQDRQLATHALETFEHELRQNHQNLSGVMPYHAQIKDQFALLSAEGSVRSFDDLRNVEGFQGFRPAFLTATAWQTAVATGALSHIDYDLVSSLSQVYTLQERFTGISDARFLLAPGAYTEGNIRSTLVTIEIYLSDVTYSGRELAQIYEQMLAVLENR